MPRRGLYGCPACDLSCHTGADALLHFCEATDAAHENCRRRQGPTEASPPGSPREVAMEEAPSSSRDVSRDPVAGAPGWERVAEVASRCDPAAFHRDLVATRHWASRIAQGLYAAAKVGDVEAVSYLLEQGADPNQQHDDGYTALMTASEAGHEHMVEVLMSAPSADVNARNSYGQTALHFAAQNGRTLVVQALLKSPNIDVETMSSGRTPAEVARGARFHEVADMLATAAAEKQTERCRAVLLDEHGKQRFDSTRARVLAMCAALGIQHAEEDGDDFVGAAPTCSICLVAPVETVMTPCSHACCCLACASQVAPGPCPVCRQRVDSARRIYLP